MRQAEINNKKPILSSFNPHKKYQTRDPETTSRNSYPFRANNFRHHVGLHPLIGTIQGKKRFPYEVFSAGSIGQRKALAPTPEDTGKYSSFSKKKGVLHKVLSIPDFDTITKPNNDPIGFLPNIKPPRQEVYGSFHSSQFRIGGSFCTTQTVNLNLLVHKGRSSMGNDRTEPLCLLNTKALPKNGKYKLEPLGKLNSAGVRSPASLDNPFVKTGFFGQKDSLESKTEDECVVYIKKVDSEKGAIGDDEESLVNVTFGAKSTDTNNE